MSLKSIAPIKSLGQNFLIDRNIAAKTVELLEIKPNDTVIEIGPGTGALTSLIIEKKCNYYAVEIDERAINDLNLKYPKSKFPHFNLLHADFKKFDIKSLFNDTKLKIIGNIPYYLSSEIFFKLFENRDILNIAVMTIQKELAQRLIAKKGTKDYGILTLAMNMTGKCSMEFDVSPKCFYPAPNVMSSVIKMDFSIENNVGDNYKEIMSIVKVAFNQRRKMLNNTLKSHFNKINEKAYSPEINSKITALTKERPEQLDVEDFVFLYNLYKNNSVIV